MRSSSCFPRSPEQKPVRLSAINTIFSWKCICCHKNSEASTVGVLLKKVCNFTIRKRLQYCKVFKNIYFEKHLWAAASENQHLTDKFRSSRPEVFCRKGVLLNFAKFTVKHLCQSLLFNRVKGLRPWHRCFPVNVVKCFRTTFFIEHLWWLLLQIYRRELMLIFFLFIFFFYPFKFFSIFNFVMAEWFCHVACFSKFYLILFFFSYKHIFIIKKL